MLNHFEKASSVKFGVPFNYVDTEVEKCKPRMYNCPWKLLH